MYLNSAKNTISTVVFVGVSVSLIIGLVVTMRFVAESYHGDNARQTVSETFANLQRSLFAPVVAQETQEEVAVEDSQLDTAENEADLLDFIFIVTNQFGINEFWTIALLVLLTAAGITIFIIYATWPGEVKQTGDFGAGSIEIKPRSKPIKRHETWKRKNRAIFASWAPYWLTPLGKRVSKAQAKSAWKFLFVGITSVGSLVLAAAVMYLLFV